MSEKIYWAYIVASKTRVIYTGMTGNLGVRIWQHKQGIGSRFTAHYNVNRLLYYEYSNDVYATIAREKEIKGWRREKKIQLIESMNPEWRDLSEDW